jgi:ABC-type Na+ transport system ATPase subunit NatA
MQEVEALVDDLVIIGAGRVALRGTPAELRERFPNRDLEEIFVDAVGGAAAAAAASTAAAAAG